MAETTQLQVLQQAREALSAVLRLSQRNTCSHENTHRGGAIWTICDDCGAKWADDRGGMPEWQDPKEWAQADEAIASIDACISAGLPAVPTDATPVGLLPPREVPSLSAGRRAFHAGTGADGTFSVKNAAELYLRKALEALETNPGSTEYWIRRREAIDASRAFLAPAAAVPADALGAMWDRFIALRSKNLGVDVKNLIGSAAAMRDDFIGANRALASPAPAAAAEGQPVAEIIVTGDDFDMGLIDPLNVKLPQGRSLLYLAAPSSSKDFRQGSEGAHAAPGVGGAGE